ncbi:heptaprenyl diphosphate synthase component 1 [Paenibacillus beijingensis]|uniref:Heptaprenyl diphosphate synthase n=1 Tax=Paenibacillus beijingensis TaxID=1126833 RepID=A0A0D5NPF4_9BACL|nr:heptaprenyl diphosphate synthase component 1 [Paenibacillus beijingensis]AJY77174.1 heptaprenyl diphosphate synthase [Paenibacillus beijingensis]
MKPYRIPEIAQKYVDYDMIQRHTELPAFPDPRIRLLFAFLNRQRFAAKHSELYSLVVSLVQLGLDTHDMVDVEEAPLTLKDMRSRQLRILAGDYFSSRFYQLLSQAGQIEMVGRLSEAICEVNRMKTGLYVKAKQLNLTAEEYIVETARLKAGMFEGFAALLEEKYVSNWPELLQTVCLCEAVRDELARTDDRFTGSWGYWHVLENGNEEERRLLTEHAELQPAFIHSLSIKFDIRGKLTDKLHGCAEHLQSLARRLDSDKLAAELLQLKEKLLYPLSATAPTLTEMR